MHSQILYENDNKRNEVPFWQLLCFVMFCVWQMGIIYYIGPALNIDGRTPLPIDADNLTVLIVAGYVCSIICMIIFPRNIIMLARISTIAALISVIGLFFSFSTTILTILIYIQCFCCCFMIGFESATMVYHFTTNSVTRHLLIAYPIGYAMIAFIQSDFMNIDFSVFRIMMVIMIVLLLIFYIKIPVNSGIRFVKKSDALIVPKKLLIGFLLLAFLGALLGVIAPAAVAGVKHGVFVAYISCAIGSALVYLLYKKTGKHPICFVAYLIGLSAIGYVLLVISEYVPSVGLYAAAFTGVGMSVCALLPLFSMIVVRQYPSKFIVPGYIALAMLAVIVQAAIVEVFRSSVIFLNLAYFGIVIILAVIFLMLEPLLLYAMQRNFAEKTYEDENSDESADENAVQIIHSEINKMSSETDEKSNRSDNERDFDKEYNNEGNKKKLNEGFLESAEISSSEYIESTENQEFMQVESGSVSEKESTGNVLDMLTKREKEIVSLISCGHSNADIAKMLFISEYTVKDHTKNIYRKLDVHSRYELMALVNRVGGEK